ncbi:MAG: N-acetylmuramoyl-L-alanine amidase, partial [Cyanobacteriota bacterium]
MPMAAAQGWCSRRRRHGRRAAALLGACVGLGERPALAASSLSAWRISRDGVLELRTAPGTSLQAFFEEGEGGRGPRVWVDFPGAPMRTRSVPSSGVLREVRSGKPDAG